MKFETLRKSHRKQIIIGALAICVIGGALTFNLTRAKYKITGDIDLVKGNINYTPYDFKIMAMYKSDDKTNYTEINTMPSEGYIINESKSYCNMSNGSKDTGAVLKTINGNHTISKIKKNDRCYLYFDKKTSIDNASELLVKVQSELKTTIPDFSQTATTDEGVYAAEDGMYGGTSYYWRGATSTNYVKFAGFCWRIVRINGDGTIRLIYDGTTCHANGTSTTESIAVTSQKYNSSYNRSEYVGWTYSTGSQRTIGGSSSNIKTQTEGWYTSNIIGTNVEKVADGKFCNDRNTASGYSWSSKPSSSFYYVARGRLQTNKMPTLVCPDGDVYILKVGTIIADEAAYAGAVCGTANNSYYLYNGQNCWTMSPGGYVQNYARMFIVDSNGALSSNSFVDSAYGLRPVINLKSDITFSGGNGTQSNPYVVAD